MGTMRWYLHPHLETPSTRALYFHELEVPQGSNSGKLYCQGGIIHFVMTGSGHTVLDGRAHEWGEGDVIAIPIKESGVTYQHFNTGVGPTRMLVCWANLDSAISPEGGVGHGGARTVSGVAGPAQLTRLAARPAPGSKLGPSEASLSAACLEQLGLADGDAVALRNGDHKAWAVVRTHDHDDKLVRLAAHAVAPVGGAPRRAPWTPRRWVSCRRRRTPASPRPTT